MTIHDTMIEAHAEGWHTPPWGEPREFCPDCSDHTLDAIKQRAENEIATPAADGNYYGNHNIAVNDRKLLLEQLLRAKSKVRYLRIKGRRIASHKTR